MDWNWLADGSGIVASGVRDVYLVTQDRYRGTATGVRITRYRAWASPRVTETAAEAARNVIIFPLGRGPGRPGWEPEMAALMEVAKVWAEQFEAGESLEGYPAWQHGHAPHMASRAGDCRCICGAGYPHLRGSDDA